MRGRDQALGMSNKQNSARYESSSETFKNPHLRRPVEINGDVAAEDRVERSADIQRLGQVQVHERNPVPDLRRDCYESLVGSNAAQEAAPHALAGQRADS